MKFTGIPSAKLPRIASSIKECINQGQWFLYKAHDSGNHNIQFFLSTGVDVYALDAYGEILDLAPTQSNNLSTDEFYFFSDLPRPASLSNN